MDRSKRNSPNNCAVADGAAHTESIRSKRILLCIGTLGGGGAERVLSLLANAFYDAGLDVRVFCIARLRAEEKYCLREGIQIDYIDAPGRMPLWSKAMQLYQLRKAIKAWRPDAIVAFISYIALQVLFAALCTGIPIIYAIRSKPERELDSASSRLLARLLYPRARGGVYQTQEQLAYFKPSLKRQDIVLYNPVEPTAFWKTPRLQVQKKIVTVCRLAPVKRVDLLLDAFSLVLEQCPEYCLEVLGEGEERAALQSKIAQLGLEGRVQMPGFSQDVSARVSSAAVFVICSQYEGMPNALIEALCMGVPCVTTDFQGGALDLLVKHGENALVVPGGDAKALAAAILRVLLDPALAQSLGEAGRQLQQTVDVQTVAAKWIAFIESCMKK